MSKKHSSESVYSGITLFGYDLFVVNFSCRFAWQCPKDILIDHYNKNVSSQHLDAGVATGYLLDHCKFLTVSPTIHLLDLNKNSLKKAAKRIRRYHPVTHHADIMKPITSISTSFDSIGITNILHCLPGGIAAKECVFKNLIPFLNERGVIFGATVLGQDEHSNFLARRLLKKYNENGVFDNKNDTMEGLEKILANNFSNYSLKRVGCMAVFSGQV